MRGCRFSPRMWLAPRGRIGRAREVDEHRVQATCSKHDSFACAAATKNAKHSQWWHKRLRDCSRCVGQIRWLCLGRLARHARQAAADSLAPSACGDPQFCVSIPGSDSPTRSGWSGAMDCERSLALSAPTASPGASEWGAGSETTGQTSTSRWSTSESFCRRSPGGLGERWFRLGCPRLGCNDFVFRPSIHGQHAAAFELSSCLIACVSGKHDSVSHNHS